MRKLLLFCIMLLGGFAADAQCVSSFTYAAAPSGNSLLRISFTNNSYYGLPFSGQIKKHFINYGDGFNSSANTPTIAPHVYNFPGTYTAYLIIQSIDSATTTQICRDSTAITVIVSYQPCWTSIFVSGTGASRTFTSNTPLGSSGVTYAWTFGDGGTSTAANPSHTYANAGFYTVTLVATIGSCTYTNTATIYISIPPAPLNCGTLSASFTSSVSGNVVTFNNTSSTIGGVYFTVVSWDYGDGGTATGTNPPPHIYTAPGVYNVKLRMQWRDTLLTTSCKDSVVHAVSITTIPVPSNIISGTIIYDTTLGTNFFKVWLITFDSASNLLTAIDSQITASISIPYFAFSSYPAGTYRLKAAVYLGSTSGTGLVPTYHDSSAYWGTANTVSHAGLATTNQRIYMRSGTLGTGSGFIGGNISLGANKGTSSAVPGQLVFLRNSTTKIVKSTLTDTAGNYSFSNIPFGSYSIYPELINYSTVPVSPILLSASNPSSGTISFNKDDAKRSIAPRSLGVGCNCTADAINVYPNPAHNTVSIAWHGHADIANQFIITTITGTEAARSPIVKGSEGTVDINISGLAQGLYFVRGSGTLNGVLTKLIIQ